MKDRESNGARRTNIITLEGSLVHYSCKLTCKHHSITIRLSGSCSFCDSVTHFLRLFVSVRCLCPSLCPSLSLHCCLLFHLQADAVLARAAQSAVHAQLPARGQPPPLIYHHLTPSPVVSPAVACIMYPISYHVAP